VGEEREQASGGEVTPITPETPVAAAKKRGFPSGFTTLRDAISFAIGALILINEVFLSPSVEPYAIGVSVALMGLPIVFGADERKSK
jgi:VIT1/CCC1 family predicted Fe2+/Mn2+ transporter